MTKPVLTSVLLPIFNAEKYLALAIDSILGQTFTDFELLLLNDGSTDGSEKIIDEYVKWDRRCKKLSWPNRGLIATLNEGLNVAQGDVIFRMDADDIAYPDRFDKQLRYIEKHPECVAIGTKVLLIDCDGWPIRTFSALEGHEQVDKEHLEGRGGAIAHSSVAMRKDVVLAVGGYREAYKHAEDLDLFLRLAEVGRLANLPDVLLEYRQHPSSIGYSKRAEQLKSVQSVINDAIDRRGLDLAKKAVQPFTSPSIKQIYGKWAWWALGDGNIKTARKYAIKAILLDPFNWRTWKLLACCIRGY